MLWHEQSWPALRQADKNIPVVIPLGSCEQHGHHMPVFVDTIQVTAIADEVHRQLGSGMILLPCLWLGSSHHHIDYPGTLSLKPSLYSQVIRSMADCILRAGFRRLLFLNGHGGNHVPVAQALSDLVCERDDADDAYLLLSTWWETTRRAIAPGALGMTTPKVTHACEYETSLMLALRPDLVGMDRVRTGRPVLDNLWIKTENEHENRVTMFRRFRRLTAAGSLGSPGEASADKGRQMLEAAAAEIAALVRDIASWPELPALGPV
jgi:creatinine amidohydrolase